MKAVIHLVTLRDASYVMQNLRPMDHLEASCQITDWNPQDFAAAAARVKYAWTVKLDGNPECVFGAQPFSSSTVIAWALGTDKMQRTIPLLTRFMEGPLRDQLIKDGYRWAEARSYGEHSSAHMWLLGLGFDIEMRLRDYGNEGEEFFLFRAPLLR